MTSTPIRVRKIPREVDAIQFDGDDQSAKACGLQLQEVAPGLLGKRNFAWGIQTLEGFMVASKGDWIITGVEGERYPCKPSVFEKTYERVEPVVVNGPPGVAVDPSDPADKGGAPPS